ncbi:hypothetical protein [Mucilaginibacter myungsuensis]|uniref:Uncharacterized protein n=1 Tax=Mucilaginibacter myungsuensis TaxID=649104 RepID=A0A929KXL4_9SPHI|nr:hypothetical protein [Mucilaginibacter myungsuensis]MBE9663519.1 hypothetical protein [Mucilaginibacter myungsuensis]MDN3600257.1 hypothetical protein [Mucilaginibacter myungsuensis]
METLEKTGPANGADGHYEFTISYSEREVDVTVDKDDDVLNVKMENFEAKLEVQPDGSLHQASGNNLPDSLIEFIKKEVLGHGK